MLFTSLVFLVFAALFFAAWPLAKRTRTGRWAFLSVASMVFYGWWDWRFLFLILASGLLDFSAALAMVRWPSKRRLWLTASVVGNVGSLVVFKYLGFLIANLNYAIGAFGGGQFPMAHLILPIGISFYTFQSMSYTIDVYRGQLKPTGNFLHFFAYLSMFPQLVAGPIIRARDLIPQLLEAPPPSREEQWDGLRLIVHGYFKKMVIADNLAPMVNAAFGSSVLVESQAYWWIIVLMFAFQIYCDFSGYSDIAIGLARWMGYRFPENFNHPYVSTSLREFWERWHISLSTWFRDYVYIPLGGNRGGRARSHLNMWITMVVSGLWHGASWTFVIWGALHALYLSVERITSWPRRLRSLGPVGPTLAALLVLSQVLVAWVFFRAESLADAADIIRIMFSFDSFDISGIKLFPNSRIVVAILGVACLTEVHRFVREKLRIGTTWDLPWLEPLRLTVMVVMCVYLRGPGSAFIYFQF